ncbi:MAG: hypothetical protein IPQ14_02755 [Candidatus Microthrix sp.]|uniref:hypothetical protein n=1 Tax=Candidatus Neomicrothrix sp. TaxID=2719034 RepID=UPI002A7DC684|nr:hypothetical protein [Candidatus Microthrix sp.]
MPEVIIIDQFCGANADREPLGVFPEVGRSAERDRQRDGNVAIVVIEAIRTGSGVEERFAERRVA